MEIPQHQIDFLHHSKIPAWLSTKIVTVNVHAGSLLICPSVSPQVGSQRWQEDVGEESSEEQSRVLVVKVLLELHKLVGGNQGYTAAQSGDFRSRLRQHLFLCPGESNIHDTSLGSANKNIDLFFPTFFYCRVS